MSLQMLVLLVPVMFGLMGFGLDLGRLYLIRGELTQAAQTMAIAAASRLNGTDQGLADATLAAQATLDDSTGHGNKYNFGSLLIGGSTGLLNSTVSDPTYIATAAGAIGRLPSIRYARAGRSTTHDASHELTTAPDLPRYGHDT